MDNIEQYLKDLNLGPNASRTDIKKNYCFIYYQYHPDYYPTEAEKSAARKYLRRIYLSYKYLLDLQDPTQKVEQNETNEAEEKAEEQALSSSPITPELETPKPLKEKIRSESKRVKNEKDDLNKEYINTKEAKEENSDTKTEKKPRKGTKEKHERKNRESEQKLKQIEEKRVEKLIDGQLIGRRVLTKERDKYGNIHKTLMHNDKVIDEMYFKKSGKKYKRVGNKWVEWID